MKKYRHFDEEFKRDLIFRIDSSDLTKAVKIKGKIKNNERVAIIRRTYFLPPPYKLRASSSCPTPLIITNYQKANCFEILPESEHRLYKKFIP